MYRPKNTMFANTNNMSDWLKTADQQRSRTSVKGFHWLLKHGFPGTSEQLVAAVDKYEREVLRLFTNRPSSCKTIEHTLGELGKAKKAAIDLSDVRIIQIAAATFHILNLVAEEEGVSGLLLDALAEAHEKAITLLLRGADTQVTALCEFVRDIRFYLNGLSSGDQRFFLLEMPSGNSIPVKLLLSSVKDNPHFNIVRSVLPRKNPNVEGLTRRSLLAVTLKNAGLRANDILIYFDEWVSGANFNTINNFIRKELPCDVFHFSAAFLTENSSTQPRYHTFCSDHDRLMKMWDIPSDRIRKVIPSLMSRLTGPYFFWAEHDRYAGYRKMQLHGSIFSSLDSTLTLLHENSKERRAAVQIFLALQPSSPSKSGFTNKHIEYLLNSFPEYYGDYVTCREELKRCADDGAKGGDCADFDSALHKLLPRYGDILNNRDAAKAVAIACAYIGRKGSLDPADRYYFDDQAPVIVELTGAAAATHKILMRELRDKLNAML